MTMMDNGAVLWQLPADIIGHLRSEAHQSHKPTYLALRKVYSLTRGRSRTFIRSFFRLVRPARPNLSPVAKAAIEALRNDGIVKVESYISPDRVAAIRSFLESQETFSVGPLRRDYRADDLLESEDVRSIIEDVFIRDLATAYLGCVPIFTQVAAWWSMRAPDATAEDLSNAAQQYHYDYDWPAFVKFFIYLTDVGPENGPFTYVLGTHENKRDWHDGRRDEDYMVTSYGDKCRAMTGKAGDLIVADTVGYHKGERVKAEARLILQLEFAVSRLGASFQYPLMPKEKRPASANGKTFDVFSK